VESFGGPLVLGSWDSQKISFIVNGAVNTSDAMTIQTTGAVTIPSVAVTGGTIDNATIGTTTASTGKFTTLESTGTASLATGSTTSIQIVGDASYPQVLAAGGTNTPLVLQPKGTGALQAQKTDSAATGGNARGANAVDWQTLRATAANVASGSTSTVSGGQNNTASAANSTVVGGATNAVSGNGSVAGGNANTASGFTAVAFGQSNTASGLYSSVVGGQSNTAAGYYNFIGSGFTNSGTASAAVTTQSATMNATTAVTLSGSNASIKVGQYITGTSIAGDTYVAAISGTALTLSKVASGSSTSTLSFFTPHGVVVGGGNNQASGSYSFIGGGGDAGTAANRNVASGDFSFVGGGAKNTATALGSVVVGGGFNSSSTVFGNIASQIGSFVGAGVLNTASGLYASVLAGSNNLADQNSASVYGGTQATTRAISGNTVTAASVTPVSASRGVSQAAILVLGRETTDATATVITSTIAAAGSTNQVALPINSAYFFKGEVIAGVTAAGDAKGWSIEGVIKRATTAASTALVGTPTVTSLYADTGAATWSVAVTADTTNAALKITVTGAAAVTIRWVAQIRTTEMTF
jgi:hypothetical protein